MHTYAAVEQGSNTEEKEEAWKKCERDGEVERKGESVTVNYTCYKSKSERASEGGRD